MSTRRRLLAGLVAVPLLTAALSGLGSSGFAQADTNVVTSAVKGADGKTYSVTNHFVKGFGPQTVSTKAANGQRKEYLLVWAGDDNVADTNSGRIKNWPLSVDVSGLERKARDGLPGPDFLAVIDATKGSSTYGKVVNTATVGPLVENEPHHMQYIWHKGNKIYAGGLFSAATYVFDVNKLPEVSVSGVSLPTQTLGGSVPDAFWVLKDGTAYGTYMGGPVVPGPYRYSDGQVRTGNGFAGSPGEVVHFDQQGKALAQDPAATSKAEDSKQCLDLPALSLPTCANPHGIQVREDLNRMVTSDYAEPRNIILDPVKAPSPYLRRPSVRIWDISKRNQPEVKNVTILPNGPRKPDSPLYTENRAAMETTVTNQPQHKGAFVMTMDGGAIYYTPDITKDKPKWREVFDDTAAQTKLDPNSGNASADGGGWLQTSPDDKFLYHAVIGRGKGALGDSDNGSPAYVESLNIQKLLASGDDPRCSISNLNEAAYGGSESDCPALAGIQSIPGGPHWGALDNFKQGSDGYYHETQSPDRLATSNYFVARTNIDGDHRVCMVNVDPNTGKLSLDTTFRDENQGTPCVNFNRNSWPHGDWGNAKPHSELFVVANQDVK